MAKISLLVLIPLIVGITVGAIGGYSGNDSLKHIGNMILSIGVPVTMTVLVGVGIMLMATGKLKDDERGASIADPPKEEFLGDEADGTPDGNANKNADGENAQSEAEKEIAEINEINSSYGYDSKVKEAEFIMRHSAENYKNASKKGKIFSTVFLALLLADFAMIVVFAALRMLIPALVCFGIFGGSIALAIVITTIVQKASMSLNSRNLSGKNFIGGSVTACLLSSTSSTGGTERYSTTRITDVVYRVIITDSKGKEYTAYSRRFYEKGETVVFVAKGKSRASIVDRAELIDKIKAVVPDLDKKDENTENGENEENS